MKHEGTWQIVIKEDAERLSAKLNRRDLILDVSVDGIIMLNLILKQWFKRVCTG
jgi:hypothetical protein